MNGGETGGRAERRERCHLLALMGMDVDVIVQQTGLKRATVRQYLAEAGLSTGMVPAVRLSPPRILAIRDECERRGLAPQELVCAPLSAIADDNLFGAVLDE